MLIIWSGLCMPIDLVPLGTLLSRSKETTAFRLSLSHMSADVNEIPNIMTVDMPGRLLHRIKVDISFSDATFDHSRSSSEHNLYSEGVITKGMI